jgi:zinc transport system ATP-binding protein
MDTSSDNARVEEAESGRRLDETAAHRSPESPVAELYQVDFSYGSAPALENVSFRILPRETVCIVGPNGGGKTTLVKLMLGLLHPDAGTIRLFGRPPQRARSRVGYMPQHLHYDPQFPITVNDVVLMGRLGRPGLMGLLGWYHAEDRAAAARALEQVGMTEFAARPFPELSGGQRQRVLVARAICGEPELLVLDEPTASVDTAAESQLLEILDELRARMAIVMVSHDIGLVSTLVGKAVCVNRRVVVHPTSELTEDVFRQMYGRDLRMVHHHDVYTPPRPADE